MNNGEGGSLGPERASHAGYAWTSPRKPAIGGRHGRQLEAMAPEGPTCALRERDVPVVEELASAHVVLRVALQLAVLALILTAHMLDGLEALAARMESIQCHQMGTHDTDAFW